MPKRILGATIGQCIHVAGILNFLRLAGECGHETQFLGAAVPVVELVAAAQNCKPDVLAVSYRLTPGVARALFTELAAALGLAGIKGMELVFGGTPPVAAAARDSGLFQAVFSGEEEPEAVLAYLKGIPMDVPTARHPGTLLERITVRAPLPVLRHHFGLPSLQETLKGARELALAEAVDVISIGPDQNAQESFFRPAEMKDDQNGAGGVPLRRPEDLLALYEATRCGNHPLLRIYSGTRDLIRWAELAHETIHNAWAAVPLFWYSNLDGRSRRPLVEAISENKRAIRWHAERGVPVEVNDPHHWSLRNAPDVVAVADAYLAAYNAKALGVTNYIAQFMWNSPPSTTAPMDLAKMLAKVDLMSELEDAGFRIIRECRCGLASLSTRPNVAKGQLAASTMLSLALRPQIIHVVGFCEGDHAATPADIIESCGIVSGVWRNAAPALPDMAADEAVGARRAGLVNEARQLLEAISGLEPGSSGPLSDPAVLARAVQSGLLDAPHLSASQEGLGQVRTRMVNGACVAVDENGMPLTEERRIERILSGLEPSSFRRVVMN